MMRDPQVGEPFRIVYADDIPTQHAFYRHELDPTLVQLVAGFGSGAELLEAWPQLVAEPDRRPNGVVIDAKMPTAAGAPPIRTQDFARVTEDELLAGLHTARVLREQHPHLLVLVVSNDEDVAVARGVSDLGRGTGYLRKDSISDAVDLHNWLRRLQEGQNLFDPVTFPLLEQAVAQKRLDRLSEAERRVFDLAIQAKAAKQVSEELRLSTKTVDTHLTSIYTKLEMTGGLNKKAALILEWYRAFSRQPGPGRTI